VADFARSVEGTTLNALVNELEKDIELIETAR